MAGALNKSAFAEMETIFGGVRVNLMSKSVYLPDDTNVEASNITMLGAGTIHAELGLGFSLKENGYINCSDFHAEGFPPSARKTPRLFGVALGNA